VFEYYMIYNNELEKWECHLLKNNEIIASGYGSEPDKALNNTNWDLWRNK
jgi:uncharacterized protein YegP (UPF0339 family)